MRNIIYLSKNSFKRSGQAVVEYIIMIGVLVGMVIAFNKVFFPSLNKQLQSTVNEVQGDASTGGMNSQAEFYNGGTHIIEAK